MKRDDDFIARDIAEYKTVELALTEAEGRLRAIFETMCEGVALNEAIYNDVGEIVDYRILDVNRAFYSTADYQGTHVIGNVATVLYGMPSDVIRSFWERQRHSNVVQNTEYFSPIRKRHLVVTTSPLVNNRFVTSFFDITEQKSAEAALRRSEQFLRTTADNVPGMLGYWTKELRCQFANLGYQNWFGYTPEQMQGMALQEFLGEHLFAQNEPYIRAVLGGENQEFERTLVTPDGELRFVLSQYIAHKVNSVVEGFFVLVTDLTHIKQTEAKLRAAELAGEIQAGAIKELRNQSKNLNTTINTLIKHTDDVTQDDRAALAQEVEQVIAPFLTQLKREGLVSKQANLVQIIEANLQQIISSYGQSTAFSSAARKLTPKEIQVASMIRQGLSSKEIASTLSLSLATISNHRKNIRRKLGLKSKTENLQVNLTALQD